ncbi:MAG: hypothetical protein IKV21_00605, partial [Clostridia bacterium]|nr:hypothetical protein [Clostridia bacterium]
SNGADTVIKNTAHAIFNLLERIKPIAAIDLYDMIGIDIAEIDFNWLVNKGLDLLYDATGYKFEYDEISAIQELTVGKLVSFTSANGETAYKMVYASENGKAEMATVVMRLVVTFAMNDKNAELIEGLLKNNLGANETIATYVKTLLDLIADLAVETSEGMDLALSVLYYVFYALDTGVDGVVSGLADINAAWKDSFADLKEESPAAAELIEDVLKEVLKDVLDAENGVVPNGFIAFFQKLISWFKGIIEWFKGVFTK